MRKKREGKERERESGVPAQIIDSNRRSFSANDNVNIPCTGVSSGAMELTLNEM